MKHDRKQLAALMPPHKVEELMVTGDFEEFSDTVLGWLDACRLIPGYDLSVSKTLNGGRVEATLTANGRSLRVVIELQRRVRWHRNEHYLQVEAFVSPAPGGQGAFFLRAGDGRWGIASHPHFMGAALEALPPVTEQSFLGVLKNAA